MNPDIVVSANLRHFVVSMIAGGIAFLGGCATELKSTRLDTVTHSPSRGVVYYLPKKVIDVDITLQLKDCRVEARENALVFHFEVGRQAEVVARTIADTAYAYIINYEDLATFTKTTAATVELTDAGTLKSLNLKVEDKTAAVLSNVVATTVKIATTVSRVPVPTSDAIASARQTEERFCGSLAKLALHKIRALEQTALSANSDDKSKIAAEILAIRRSELTARMFVEFDPQPHSDGLKARHFSARAYPNQALVDGWISERGMIYMKDKHPDLFVGSELGSLRTEITTPLLPLAAGLPSASAPGIVYRQNVETEVAICAVRCRASDGQLDVPRSERVYSAKHVFPQLGPLAVLPLKNGMFEDNILKADWNDSGGVSRIEFSSSSQAEKASAALLDGVTKASEFVAAKRAAKVESSNTGRTEELAVIEHQKSLLRKKIELKEVQDEYDSKVGN